ncbi:prolyl 4-hydroxylase subunit alpha-2 [Drosophila teissieri]|uniref:prolyl 4-hydroxylase subunit alpha-2 n=1 Tax=Drosophila teissieri TaxID=7243 RepID=UPI001CBA4E65|nr:prolyl 4-hydroxylase subunit alpha-2 [Drosophila teissieri]
MMSSVTKNIVVSIIIGLSWIAEGSGDRINYVTSAEEKMNLLQKDRELIIVLDSYAAELEDKIIMLKRIVEELKQPLEKAKNREEEYLSNPINRLSLMRQMHEDWEPLEKLLKQPVGQEKIALIEKMREDLPVEDDLVEANQALFRIVHTYDLEPKDVSTGLVDGVQYSGKMSAGDCFTMGTFSFKAGSYPIATKWLSAAKDLLVDQPRGYQEVIGVTKADVTLLLARSLIASGNVSIARDMLMRDSMFGGAGNALALHFLRNSPKPSINLESCESGDSFNQLCRSVSRRQTGESKPSKLHCRYNTTTTPFLRLAPLRMEELSLHPYVVLYHNVLSDPEIEKLQLMSEPFLERAKVFRVEKGSDEIGASRAADGAWLPHQETEPEDLEVLNRIGRRVGDMTGLSTRSGRQMQLLKYGFGGHFAPHYDYFDSKTIYLETVGDRIATVLFYLNNVDHGGATAFPRINLAVPTQRGSALFWHNLDGQSYDYDTRTFHGACPLIYGTKLVMTRWIYELDQMLLIPAVLPPRSRNFSRSLRN